MCQPQGVDKRGPSYLYGVFHLAESWSAVKED